MRFEAVEENKRARGWAVWENDGSEDGRLVAGNMKENDAKLVASLLNYHSAG